MAAKENPIVTVRMASYHVSVLGEVTKPGIISVPQEKMSILEALAQAGDLTIYGKRDNVLLIRQDAAGEKHTYRMNLNDANIINSPFYYLQQNDIIYVEPNKVKAQSRHRFIYHIVVLCRWYIDFYRIVDCQYLAITDHRRG